jgi:uncharacterized protein YydD (DUF2326 family)
MKLASLYSNKEEKFPTIRFREGFNVVFAQVKEPNASERDVHNLGKTFLIEVIDFCLIARVDRDHPFKDKADLFRDFVFYLELETDSGDYVTIQRAAAGRQAISIQIETERNKILRELPHSEWKYPSLGQAKAKGILNDLLGLDSIKPYTYRKGLGYFLRSQSDYIDEFCITSKFGSGRHRDWKPFVALMLGFDHELLLKKYDLDDEIDKLSDYCKRLEKEAGTRSEEYDEIRGRIQILENKRDRLRQELDDFSFKEVESEISEDVVLRIEQQITELNQKRYTIDYELQEIEHSLQSEYAFDIDKINQVFQETRVFLPESLVHSYQELVDFNRRLSSDRSKRLRELREKLYKQRNEIEDEIERLDKERQSALAILQEMETFKKYKELQGYLYKYERQISELEEKLAFLNRAVTIQSDIEKHKQNRDEIINQIRTMIRSGNSTYKAIRKAFANYVEAVLNVPAVLSVKPNDKGNLEFSTQTIDPHISDRETSEALGTSYKKILCACFDLAVLSVYASKRFYHFVYHDGIFEGLDNRKKVSLLKLVRQVCDEKGIQHILTVIDSDLPRDERDKKLLFQKEEIVRELHDRGDEGRLFRMPAF